MPWLTVLQNVELGLEARNIPAEERRERAEKAIDMVGLDGLSWGLGYGSAEAGEQAAPGASDSDNHATIFANYAMGPATVGYQLSSNDGGTAGTASNEVEIYGISFAVNENLTLSVNQMDRTVEHVSAADVTEETTGFGASYTMGSASIRLLNAETSNLAGVSTAKDVEHTEISLMLAF